jgi:hypothetical protein
MLTSALSLGAGIGLGKSIPGVHGVDESGELALARPVARVLPGPGMRADHIPGNYPSTTRRHPWLPAPIDGTLSDAARSQSGAAAGRQHAPQRDTR